MANIIAAVFLYSRNNICYLTSNVLSLSTKEQLPSIDVQYIQLLLYKFEVFKIIEP